MSKDVGANQEPDFFFFYELVGKLMNSRGGCHVVMQSAIIINSAAD